MVNDVSQLFGESECRMRNTRNSAPAGISTAFIAFPTILIYGLDLFFNYTITDCIKWMYENSFIYIMLALALSISGTVGGCIDGAIAFYKYKKRNTNKHFSFDQAIKIIKFGSDKEVKKGQGVCDLRLKSTVYNLMSNILGAMCHVAIHLFIKTLPGYVSYLDQTEWINYVILLSPIMVFPSLSQFGELQKREYPGSVESDMDNPDNFYMNRIHVFLDSISLWFTFTMVLIWGFTYFCYTLSNFQKYELSCLFIFPILALVVFLLFLAASPLAITHKTISVTEYKIVKWIIISIVIFTLIFYRPSLSHLFIIAICILILLLWEYMVRKIENSTREEQAWLIIIPIMMFILLSVVVALQKLN